jgi:uncharacterized protein
MSINLKACAWSLIFLLSCVTGFSATSSDLRLVEAVKNKDHEAVRSLLKQHVLVNARAGDGATALAWAAHWDDLDTADLLIHSGANVNAANELGVSPLSLACGNGNSSMVDKLLKAGANAKAALGSGETVLMECVRGGNLDAVKLLLAGGADVNAKPDDHGQTALMWAAAEKHPEMVRALLDHGADVHVESNGGFTPLLFAARSGDLESAKTLLASGANPNDSAADGSALLIACASGHEELSIYLLEKGAKPNVADDHGITPLHYALLRGMSAARSLHATSQDGWDYYYRPDMVDLIKALLAHGADPNAKIEEKPRLEGPFQGSESPNHMGSATPFLLAAASADIAAMRILKAAGADPNRVTSGAAEFNTQAGTTALMLAAGIGGGRRIPIRKEDAMVHFVQPFDGLQIQKQYLEAVKFLVEEMGADVNAVDQGGSTALHLAAWRGADLIIQYLVDKGAKIDAKDMYGQTALSIAEEVLPMQITDKGKAPYEIRKSSAELLLNLGAQASAFHKQGTQPDKAQ